MTPERLRRIAPSWARKLADSPLVRRLRRQPDRVTRQHVIWAYRLLLGREPENREVIAARLNGHYTVPALRSEILTSPEFREREWNLGWLLVSLDNVGKGRRLLTEIEDGLRLWFDLSDHFIGVGIARGIFEPDERAFVRRVVQPGQTALDIGGEHRALLATRRATAARPRARNRAAPDARQLSAPAAGRFRQAGY